MKDFFISYTHTDEDWAIWIAWQLEAAGHTTVIQAWDFHAGENFVSAMHEAASNAKQTIAVLSPAYLKSDFAKSEWTAAFAADPTGKKGKLIPIMVRPVDVKGILGPITHIDLIGLSRKEASELLLTKIKASEDGSRAKPAREPNFPGESSPNESLLANSWTNPTEKKPLDPMFRLGLLDKKNQAKQIAAQVPKEHRDCNKRAWGFLLTGHRQEWPQALSYKLAYVAEMDLKVTLDHAADVIELDAEKLIYAQAKADEYLWELLGSRLNCPTNPTAIKKVLEEKGVCQVIYRELSSDEASNHDFLANMLEAWSKLQLAEHSPSHFLLLIRDEEDEKTSGWWWYGKKRTTWFKTMQDNLAKHQLAACLLPPLETPRWEGDINDWLKRHVSEELRDGLKTAITQAHGKAPAIPHGELKKTLLPLLKQL